MDITTKLGQAIKEMEDLKKALTDTDQNLNKLSQQKNRILENGLIVQGRIQALQELNAEQTEKPADVAPAADVPKALKAPKKAATPLEVK